MNSTRFLAPSMLLLATFLTARPAAAADETALADPVVGKLHEKVTRFLDSVAEGKESAAFDDLLVGSQLLEQAGAVRALVDKSKEIVDRYGAHRESEQISAKRIGKDVVLMKYLYKCEKFPVVWHVTYYRDFSRTNTAPDDRWVVISVRFDTQVEALGY
jgi:hypothetical protein